MAHFGTFDNATAAGFPKGEIMVQRHQRGWLKEEKHTQPETWVLFFCPTRESDSKSCF
jgi:hypothetical protein